MPRSSPIALHGCANPCAMPRWNARAISAVGALAKPVSDDRVEQRTEVELAVRKWKWICIVVAALRPSCSSHIAACPSKVVSLDKSEQRRSGVEESSHRRSGKCAHTADRQDALRSHIASRSEMALQSDPADRQAATEIPPPPASGYRAAASPPANSSFAKMGYTFETTRHAAGKNLATPDASVVSVACAIEADTDNGLLPGATLGKHRRQVRAMMLHRTASTRRQARAHARRGVLRMAIVHHQQIVPSHVIHRNQIFDSLLESVESLVVVQIADMLAHKCLRRPPPV